MAEVQDRILVVESDPLIRDTIARQALKAAGYQVFSFSDASAAISQVEEVNPDVVIANLELPDLSGKDLLVALASQGYGAPFIMTARKGMEAEIIQAFRLGAADYLIWPARETEILAAVERNLKQVRERRERERLARQLQQTNQELQQKVRELTTIFSVGKAVTSLTDQSRLFDRILESVMKVTQADLGWFLLKDENSKAYLLSAQHKLPASLPVRLNQPWDDGISSLVAMSGEPLSIHGEPLKRFKIAALGQSILIVPVKAASQVIGLLTLLRRDNRPYGEGEQRLVEAIADFASISLVNARLFRTLEERARQHQALAAHAQTGEKITMELIQAINSELSRSLEAAKSALTAMETQPGAAGSHKPRHEDPDLQAALSDLEMLAESIHAIQAGRVQRSQRATNLSDLTRRAVNQFNPLAHKYGLLLVSNLPAQPVYVQADANHLSQVLTSLLSYAIKYCEPGGQVRILLEKTNQLDAHISVSNSGATIEQRQLSRLFETPGESDLGKAQRFGGIGIGLPLVKELVTRNNGKVWAESKKGQGASFHITLPAS